MTDDHLPKIVPLSAQYRQLKRALDLVCSDDPNWNKGIPQALAYIEMMEENLKGCKSLLIRLEAGEKARQS